MAVERVAPLPADVRDIFGSTLECDVDERGFEHRELGIGLRAVADPGQGVDVTATDRAGFPFRARDRHLRGLARDLDSVVRFTGCHAKVR
jgi:hypothetical protein